MSLILDNLLMRRRALGKPDEPVAWAVAVSSCPLCRTRLVGGACPTCADRAMIRVEHAAARSALKAGKRPIDLRVLTTLAVGLGGAIVGALLLLGPHATALSTRGDVPEQHPSSDQATTQLVEIADALDAIATDAQRHLVEETNTSPEGISELLEQVTDIEDRLNAINPAADGNDGAAWKVLSESCGQLRATIASFSGLTPDVDGQGVAYVRGRLKKTRGLLRSTAGAPGSP